MNVVTESVINITDSVVTTDDSVVTTDDSVVTTELLVTLSDTQDINTKIAVSNYVICLLLFAIFFTLIFVNLRRWKKND